MATRMGAPYDSNPDKISFRSIRSGSVLLSGNIGVAGTINPNTVLDLANSITNGNTAVGSFNLVGSVTLPMVSLLVPIQVRTFL